jgi:hypothetical protein
MQELLRASRRSKLAAERNAVTSVSEPQGLPTSVARYLAQYDRKHLYKQVWSAPMPKIGKHYGVTEIEIAKACRHLHIPMPPQGYWTEKDAGLPVSPPPMLPPLQASIPKPQADERSS